MKTDLTIECEDEALFDAEEFTIENATKALNDIAKGIESGEIIIQSYCEDWKVDMGVRKIDLTVAKRPQTDKNSPWMVRK